MQEQIKLYYNNLTGAVEWLTPSQYKVIRRLSKAWRPVEYTKNDKGESVMRMRIGGATVDISENKEVIGHVNAVAN